MAINDLIPGSLGWMLFNMRSVHPVYDGSMLSPVILTDDQGNYLTDDQGNYLTGDNTYVSGNLVRWV